MDVELLTPHRLPSLGSPLKEATGNFSFNARGSVYPAVIDHLFSEDDIKAKFRQSSKNSEFSKGEMNPPPLPKTRRRRSFSEPMPNSLLPITRSTSHGNSKGQNGLLPVTPPAITFGDAIARVPDKKRLSKIKSRMMDEVEREIRSHSHGSFGHKKMRLSPSVKATCQVSNMIPSSNAKSDGGKVDKSIVAVFSSLQEMKQCIAGSYALGKLGSVKGRFYGNDQFVVFNPAKAGNESGSVILVNDHAHSIEVYEFADTAPVMQKAMENIV